MFKVDLIELRQVYDAVEGIEKHFQRKILELSDTKTSLRSLTKTEMDETVYALSKVIEEFEENLYSLRRYKKALENIMYSYAIAEKRVTEEAEMAGCYRQKEKIGFSDLGVFDQILENVKIV